MSKKIVKYLFYAAVLLFVCYNSVYFKKLDEVKSEAAGSKFDAAKYAENYYNKLQPVADSAIEINALLAALKSKPEETIQQHSNALGIGNIRYFLVRGQGKIEEVDESSLLVAISSGNAKTQLAIAMEFVYGNAIRDASGIIKLSEFNSTTDLNNVSAEVNKIVRTKVLPPIKSNAQVGDTIKFTGALQLNKKFLKLDDIEVMPVSLTLNQASIH